jgi:hypothetical protein
MAISKGNKASSGDNKGSSKGNKGSRLKPASRANPRVVAVSEDNRISRANKPGNKVNSKANSSSLVSRPGDRGN